MSLINHVLNQLERRGAEQIDAARMVRSVHSSENSSKMWRWTSVLFVIILLGLSVLWLGKRKHAPVFVSVPPVVVVETKPAAPVTMAASIVAPEPVLQLSFALDTVALPSLEVQPEPVSKPAKTVMVTKAILKPLEASKFLPTRPVVVVNEPTPLKQISSKQQAEATFRKAVLMMQQGRINEAFVEYRAALSLDAGYDPARQALVSLLLENKRRDEAEQVLQEGLANRPEQTAFAMMTARLQVERQAVNEALLTLERSLPFAQQQGDYQAFFAALLQRQNRHQDALLHYQVAVQLVPNNGLWLMGEGISLQALQRNEEAKELYKRALLTQTLQPDLQLFVQQKLKTR